MESVESLNTRVDELQGKVDGIKTGMTAVLTHIDELKAQVASGAPATQEDLDALGAKVAAIGSTLDTVSEEVTTAQT